MNAFSHTNNNSNDNQHIVDEFVNLITDDVTLDEQTKNHVLRNLRALKKSKVNILITGATGSGKSSTINALFDCDKAKVGVGVDPETMNIAKYELKNIVLFDSPGLGDGKEADNRHAKNIMNKLYEKDSKGELLIDLVLVVLDGGSRDLGTSFELINQVIIPNLGEDKSRLLVAINQADMAMKGRYWDYDNNKPEPTLIKFLDDKVASTRQRILEATGVDVEPIYYSAGYKEADQQQQPYNLSKLLAFMLRHTKLEKRILIAPDLNRDQDMWKDDENLKEHVAEIKKSFYESVIAAASQGADIGAKIGSIFGSGGAAVGRVLGSVVGGVVGAVSSFFSSWW